ncbi:low-density lipoprotein receptor-related protein 11 [Manacus vitellinus]|uniref:low-density lipoprotein receptor-related protein 11 n=1 Tax=Manacus vitellinus TaxID=328815 RepID=UPI00115E6F8C|nr:low-density lipoprotein receptor-related protein 11 [Manacus vitellinus]
MARRRQRARQPGGGARNRRGGGDRTRAGAGAGRASVRLRLCALGAALVRLARAPCSGSARGAAEQRGAGGAAFGRPRPSGGVVWPALRPRRRNGVARAEEEYDEPPQCKAGQDIVLQSPVDWVLLDGRESSDDHGIVQYEWTLLQGDSSVEMQVPQPGTLKLSHVQEGGYIFQLTVTDTAGQRSSDNVSVTVLPMVHSAGACVGVCSRYQFICDDGCCIDITFACDGVRQCPDGSDETFCQNLSPGRKTVTHAALGTTQQRTVGLTENTDENFSAENTLKATVRNQPFLSVDADMSNQSLSQGPKKQISGFVPDNSSSGKRTDDKSGNGIMVPKRDQFGGSHPVPETGAVLPLALGLAITALLLLMVACRLRLVKQKLKKARPITSEESDYLINGMYL